SYRAAAHGVEFERFFDVRLFVPAVCAAAVTEKGVVLHGGRKLHIAAEIGEHRRLTVQGKAAPSFDQAVRSVLKENGYTFAVDETEQTPKVEISFKEEEEYLNIRGFVKFTYHFTMRAPDKNGRMIDVLATSFEETGRNQKQAYSLALAALKAYLQENILNLNF
ncbi:MAG: hypothetical protein IKR09_00830, partial [Alphaproteobacteria bacterium]|nr:hypothetical protein [Alphaproteobacteria bacterium]